MGKSILVNALIASAALTVSATPAFAMKEPPKDPPISSSGGSTGGSTSGSSGGSSGGTPVPEPASIALFGAGAAAFMLSNRRRRKAAKA